MIMYYKVVISVSMNNITKAEQRYDDIVDSK